MVNRTRRQTLQACVATLLAATRNAIATSPPRLRRIAFLAPDNDPMLWVGPLQDLGWVEGRNLVIERRITDGVDGLAKAAQELVAADVDIIVTDGTNAARAAKAATTRIPIVMAAVGDPVATGLVASLARPGGNITGYSILATETAAKRAQLVRELLPSAQRVAIVMDSENAMYGLLRRRAEDACRALGIEPRFVTARTSDALAVALVDPALRVDAVEVDPDVDREDSAILMRALAPRRLPVIAASRQLLDAGALVYFDVDRRDHMKRVAQIIAKILHGAPPASIPVEQPTSFVLVVNAKAAKAMGIDVPQSLLLRADEVKR